MQKRDGKSTESKGESPAEIMACTCANFRRVARVVTQSYDAALRPVKLKATQFTLLGTLSLAGEVPITRLAALMVMDRTTLTRNLQPLVRRGLIEVEQGQGSDQRVHKVRLTDDGRALFEEAKPLWRTVQNRFSEGFGPERWNGLLGDLKDVISMAKQPGI